MLVLSQKQTTCGKKHDTANNFACSVHPQCSISELEPRLFSFNSHFGACNRCDGLGTVHEFDPDLIVPDPSGSITRGAIVPWHRAGPAVRRKYRRQLKKFCDIADVPASIPFAKLSKPNKKLLLHGGTFKGSKARFTGIIPELEKRFKQTTSDNVRTWLMSYMTKMTCPACVGQRIRIEARSVTVESKTGDYIQFLPLPR